MARIIDTSGLVISYIDKIVEDRERYFRDPMYYAIIQQRIHDYIDGLNDAVDLFEKKEIG